MTRHLYLLRHAESEANVDPRGLIGGRGSHFPITEQGWKQAHALGYRMQDEPYGGLVVSTAVRTKETHFGLEKTLSRVGLHLPEPVYDERLLEKSQGDWTGLPRTEKYTPEIIAEMDRDSLNFKPPGGESMYELQQRTHAALEDAFSMNDIVWAVTHGYVIKGYLQKVMQFDPAMAWKVRIDNASVTHLMQDHRGWHVMRINDSAHIKDIGMTPEHIDIE